MERNPFCRESEKKKILNQKVLSLLTMYLHVGSSLKQSSNSQIHRPFIAFIFTNISGDKQTSDNLVLRGLDWLRFGCCTMCMAGLHGVDQPKNGQIQFQFEKI